MTFLAKIYESKKCVLRSPWPYWYHDILKENDPFLPVEKDLKSLGAGEKIYWFGIVAGTALPSIRRYHFNFDGIHYVKVK